jgi:hypothetical protein
MFRRKKMKKMMKVALLIALISSALGPLSTVSLSAQIFKPCCIAGNYRGEQTPYAKPNCPPPKTQQFAMVVVQGRPCLAAVKGTVTDESGVAKPWIGTLSPGPRGCCAFEGSFVTAGGSTLTFKGTFCLKLGKWRAEGTWEELKCSDPCKASGTWWMKQV